MTTYGDVICVPSSLFTSTTKCATVLMLALISKAFIIFLVIFSLSLHLFVDLLAYSFVLLSISTHILSCFIFTARIDPFSYYLEQHARNGPDAWHCELCRLTSGNSCVLFLFLISSFSYFLHCHFLSLFFPLFSFSLSFFEFLNLALIFYYCRLKP